MESILAEARSRRDDWAAQEAEKELEILKNPRPAHYIPDDDDDDDDDDEDDDDLDLDDLLDEDDEVDPFDARMLDRLEEVIRSSSHDEIRKVREMWAKDMPPELFDMIVGILRQKSADPGQRRKSRARRGGIQRQRSLFET